MANIAAKHSTVLARWPKKLISPSPNPPEFKELDAPALLGRLKIKNSICKTCYKSFSVMNSLRIHVSTVHEKKKPYTCQFCEKSFGRHSNLYKHVAAIHEGKKPFKCEMCDFSSFKRDTLINHAASIHGIKKLH